jgi:hypothetical protein
MREEMRKISVMLIAFLLIGTAVLAETQVKGELFPQWHMNFSEGADNYSAFELTRSYVTVTSDLNPQTLVRFTLDLRSTNGFDGYDVILKYGYIDWKPTFWKRGSFRFGLQQTMYIDYMNQIWNRRYLEKTASDLYGMLTSADLGASTKISFGSNQSTALHLAVFNGTSYSDVNDANKNKDLNAVLLLKPAKAESSFKNSMILGQIYLGTQNVDLSGGLDAGDYQNNMISVGGILDYQEQFSIGLDANWQTLGTGSGTGDLDISAVSLFGTYYFGKNAREGSFMKNLNVFGRVDITDPNSSVSDDGQTLTILGVECVTSSKIKTSLNLRMVSYENSAISTDSFLFFNALVAI